LKVGFIGLGAMGRPMALNLVKRGHALAVWSRRPESAQPLLLAGAARYASPAEVAQHSEVIFTMVTAGTDVDEVALGETGIMHGAAPGTVVIDCSTIDAATTRRVGRRLHMGGVHMLDAPVSGGETGAAAGTLSIMVGGDEAVFERVRPLLECVGKTLVYIGPSGSGQVAKAANQLALVVTIHGIAEAMVFARANGVDFGPIRQAMLKGVAGSRMLEIVGQRMLDREFVMGIDASLHHKDAHIVLQTAQESRTAVPGAALAAQAFNALFARPGVKWDSAALVAVLEEMNGQHV
jgi:3-hydroxyisobutyrate dehydrogenase-like beta-hydroxyacid dehydrogenase